MTRPRGPFRGRCTDEAYGWCKGQLDAAVSLSAVSRDSGLARSTIRYNMRKQAPSLRKPNSPPKMTTAAKRTITRRRQLVKQAISTKSVKTRTKENSTVSRRTAEFLYSSPSAVRRFLASKGFEVSLATVRRDLLTLNFKCRVRPKAPVQTGGDRSARVAFARRELRRRRATDWQQFVFSDEKIFDNNEHDGKFQWVQDGDVVEPRGFSNFPAKLHVWGAIGVGFRKLVVYMTKDDDPTIVRRGRGRPKAGEVVVHVDPKKYNITALKYRDECLKPLFDELPEDSSSYIFMQDGAGCHGKEASKWLDDNDVPYIEDWPARSPDLNPIETLWSILNHKVAARGPLDRADLKKFVVEEFNKVPQATLDKLVLSYKKRLNKCIEVDGAHFKP